MSGRARCCFTGSLSASLIRGPFPTRWCRDLKSNRVFANQTHMHIFDWFPPSQLAKTKTITHAMNSNNIPSPKGRKLVTSHGSLNAILCGHFVHLVEKRPTDDGVAQQEHTLVGHGRGVCSVAFSPDGITLASGSYDNTVILWDLALGQRKQTLSGHTRSVCCVSCALLVEWGPFCP